MIRLTGLTVTPRSLIDNAKITTTPIMANQQRQDVIRNSILNPQAPEFIPRNRLVYREVYPPRDNTQGTHPILARQRLVLNLQLLHARTLYAVAAFIRLRLYRLKRQLQLLELLNRADRRRRREFYIQETERLLLQDLHELEIDI